MDAVAIDQVAGALVHDGRPGVLQDHHLQDRNKLLNGNWPLANQQMARALAFAGYDYKFVFGNGFHSNNHGRAILPDSLRWLWRGWESEQPR